MTTETKKSPISASARKCLEILLNAELDGAPVELHSWRAANAKKIPSLSELQRAGTIEGHIHATIKFWGLMCAPGKRARVVLANCERLFKALRKHYPEHPRDPLSVAQAAAQTALDANAVLTSALFLARSPAYLVINGEGSKTTFLPNEHYVTFRGFDEVKERARREWLQSMNPSPPLAILSSPLSLGSSVRTLAWTLESAEAETVRESWQKAVERIPTDPAGAITAARSLLEAACKQIIEEHGESTDHSMDLPDLHRRAAKFLRLDARPDVDESLRRVLQAGATMVNGLAQLRNKLGDAHGKSSRSPKPAKRHAEFIVMICGAMAGLLLSTMDAQRTP